MNITFSLQQISGTVLDANLILLQNKKVVVSRFMEIKTFNPKLRQDPTAKEWYWPSSILKRYRQNINKFSTYRIPPNGLGSKELKKPQKQPNPVLYFVTKTVEPVIKLKQS